MLKIESVIGELLHVARRHANDAGLSEPSGIVPVLAAVRAHMARVSMSHAERQRLARLATTGDDVVNVHREFATALAVLDQRGYADTQRTAQALISFTSHFVKRVQVVYAPWLAALNDVYSRPWRLARHRRGMALYMWLVMSGLQAYACPLLHLCELQRLVLIFRHASTHLDTAALQPAFADATEQIAASFAPLYATFNARGAAFTPRRRFPRLH